MRYVISICDFSFENNFDIGLGDFLDGFYRSSDDIRREIISKPPQCNDKIYAALLAACVHKLANDFNLDVPEWVYDKRFYLKDPYFGGNVKGNLRLLFMYKSPPEFKHRNLFVCENILKRV